MIKSKENDFESYLKSAISDDEYWFLNANELSYPNLKPFFNEDIHLRASLFIMVLNGSCDLEINHHLSHLFAHDVVLLSFGHFFKVKKASRNFKCIFLYVSNSFVEEMFSSDMLYKRVKYGVKMYKNPIIKLQENCFNLLVKRTKFLQEIISVENHLYQKELQLNALRIFFLDLSNIIEKIYNEPENTKPSMDEVYFQKFLDLLGRHYKTEHLVDFYAHKINITPHYLTLIVKKLSGQTVSEFIYQLLFSEAKILLQKPENSIQQIAEQLNFSDQSAFGKFFKRKSGLSPREFKNNH